MNSNSRVEIAVGLFLVLGLAAFGWLALRLGEVSWLTGGTTYTLYAEFENVAGIKTGSEVQIAGVAVGAVAELRLNDAGKAVAAFKLNKSVQVPKDSIASVKSQGIIGDKFIRILPGGDMVNYQPGETIVDTESSLDIESLISKFALGGVK
ncbi:outer membrane lipid asymmetry maintenance protein MlaD [Candidatus Electronema sp. TJ]|uniref:outer membrane lipid asymmetry maintenance protein MlaD n=1 Tax=Candidatus Electronema sp. TJ TaxID=3401573 RepID=UPI003AA8E9EA